MKQIMFETLINLTHLFVNKTTDISTQAIITLIINKDYVRITPFISDATPLNYNTMFTDRLGNNSLNSTFNNTQENSNGTRNLTQQDIQTPSHLINEEIVETMPTTTQQSIFPIHLTLTTPKKNKNTAFPQTTLQSTLKPSIIPKNSQMDYQKLKSVTLSRQLIKQKKSNRNSFSGHN